MKRTSFLFALLLLAPAVAAPAAADQGAAPRVLRVKAVADEAFRENKNWEKEIREHFLWADQEFRKFAGVGLELVAVDRWTTHESESMSLLLEELRAKADKGEAEIVVGFTGHPAPELQFLYIGTPNWSDTDTIGAPSSIRITLPHIMGIAMPFGDRVVVRRSEDKRNTRYTLLHEVAHLFGGVHVKEKSVLYSTNERVAFALDSYNQRVFELTRNRDFNLDVHEVSRHELDRLVALYREAPLRHERDFDTNIRLGYLLLAAGEADAAVEEFQTAIDIDPSETLRILRGAVIPELESFAEEHGATPEVRYTLGRAYSTIGNYGKAAQSFYPNCFGNPPHAPSCAELGGTLLQAKQAEQAEKILQRALELDEAQVNAHNNLGVLYSVLGQSSKALEHFNRAAELQPDKVSVHYNTGMAYLTLDLLDPAADAFRRTLELKPEHEAARSKLAVTLARQGKTKEAREEIRDFEKRQRLSAQLIRDMAEVYFRGGDMKKAWNYLGFAKKGGLNVNDLEQEMLAGTAKPRPVKTSDLIEQAQGYWRRDRYADARKLLEQARAQDPQNAEVHYWLGRVAREEKKLDEAAEHLQEALRLKEKFPDTHLELAELAYDRKEYSATVTHLTRYLELESYPYSRAYFLLGSAHFQLNDLATAEEKLKKAIQQNDDYGDAFYMLAAVYTKQEKKADAIAELNLALNSRALRSSFRPEAHYNLAVLCHETGKTEDAWKHARIARRLGYANVGWLLDELAKVSPAPPEEPGGPEAVALQSSPPSPAVAAGGHYTISDPVLGNPPGVVRAGQLISGRLKLKRGPLAEGRVAISLKLSEAGATFWQQWLFTYPNIPQGKEETEVFFQFALLPDFLKPGEYRAALSVTAPLQMGQMPPPTLSNELEVAFRVVAP